MAANDDKLVLQLEPGQTADVGGLVYTEPDALADTLDASQTREAIEELISYPKVIRSKIDLPVTNQAFSIISYNLLDEPKEVKEGTIYGFVKVRGGYGDKNLAKRAAADIVKEQDSVYECLIAPTGHWIPITNSNARSIVDQTIDVGDENNEQDLLIRDEAHHQKMKENARRRRELMEREQELRDTQKYNSYDDVWSIDYFATRIKTDERMDSYIKELQVKLDSLIEKRRENALKVVYALQVNPQYEGEWIDHYNEKHSLVGIAPTTIEMFDLEYIESIEFDRSNYTDEQLAALDEKLEEAQDDGAGIGQ